MIGVVADDTTGANDIGIMFANRGYKVLVYNFDADLPKNLDCDCLILDTDSRLDYDDIAQYKVHMATEKLKAYKCRMYINKTCSVFRGNIGLELDTMMDALGEDFCPIVLAYPKTGRTTKEAIHYVNGEKLANTAFRNDPVHPMRRSNLIDILKMQTKRAVGHIHIDKVRQGSMALDKYLALAKEECSYCILDAETQDDLRIIAKAIESYSYIGGSAAIAEELAAIMPSAHENDVMDLGYLSDDNGVLIVSGSLTPQTTAQVKYLKDQKVRHYIFNSMDMFDETIISRHTETIVSNAVEACALGKDVLIVADNSPEGVRMTKEKGRSLGFTDHEISKKVSKYLAEMAEAIIEQTDLKRLVVAGGDTSGTICKTLNIEGNLILEEIEAGVPSGLAIGKDLLIVLKSGSFGGESFLMDAANHLKELS